METEWKPNTNRMKTEGEITEKMDKWDERFIKITQAVSSWSSCIRSDRKIGAIIVKGNRIVSTGYNGAPAGLKSCAERGECMRDSMEVESGTRAEICYAVHAEQNAIAAAARLGTAIEGATMYCTHRPCSICAKMIVNAGIGRVVYLNDYPDEFATEILKEGNVVCEKYEESEDGNA